jgi:hypothetical protein
MMETANPLYSSDASGRRPPMLRRTPHRGFSESGVDSLLVVVHVHRDGLAPGSTRTGD